MAQGRKLEVEDAGLVLPHPADADGVAVSEVAVEPRLGPVVLVEDDDGRAGRGGAPEPLGLGLEVPQGGLGLVGRGRGPALEGEGDAGGVAVHDGDAVAGGGDAEGGLLGEGCPRVVEGAEDLAGLGLELVLLAADEGHDVVDDVHGAHARVARARDGLHGDDADGGYGAEGGLEGGEGPHEADDGAVGVAHEEAAREAVGAPLVRYQVQVGQVDGRHDEGDEGVAAVVFGVGEDGDFGLEELHLCFFRQRQPHITSFSYPLSIH